jgi:hypothetical protein
LSVEWFINLPKKQTDIDFQDAKDSERCVGIGSMAHNHICSYG